MVLKIGMILILVGSLALVTGTTCLAKDVTEEAAPEYTAFTRFKAGLTNLLTGWMEIPRQINETYKDTNNVVETMLVGTLKGAFYCLGRTLAGVVDTAFFFVAPTEPPLVEPLYKI